MRSQYEGVHPAGAGGDRSGDLRNVFGERRYGATPGRGAEQVGRCDAHPVQHEARRVQLRGARVVVSATHARSPPVVAACTAVTIASSALIV